MLKLPKITTIKTCAKTRFFCIETVDLQFSNGVKVQYERLNAQGSSAVIVVPMLDEHTVLLIREYCVGTHRYELYCPKGKIEKSEDILEAANREIKEEVGYGAKKLELIKSVTSVPGYSNQITHIVLARDLYKEQLIGDEPETLEVVAVKLSELEQLLLEDDFNEARSIAALFIVRNKIIKE